ncbi:MAG TPA: FkbM family methyltransferase [Stellaceae bacterium]|nr:FkbM family methyltransferase [Stellaceae bacterium]
MTPPSKFVLHHVGGRWGNRVFPLLPRFERDFVNVLYEADSDAIPGIYEACKNQQSELIVLPFCLAEGDSDATLNLYLNSGLTSLRSFSAALKDRHLHLFGVDFDFGGAGARLLKRKTIATRSLDSVLASSGDACPAPDFLSLDVQGTEYEVLAGARNVLRDKVCGVIAEVEFGEMYVGQKRFQDVYDLLREFGFEFVRFLSLGEASGPAAPLGFRSSGYQSWADALFLRRPDSIPTKGKNYADMLRKLCFVAIVFGNIELAIDCLGLLRQLAPSEAHASSDVLAYAAFIAELAEVYERTQKVWPPVFSRILPQHRSLDYSRAGGPEQWPEILEGLRDLDEHYVGSLKKLQKPSDTEFEALLRRYGFVEQADRVNHTRRHQAHDISQAIIAARRKS